MKHFRILLFLPLLISCSMSQCSTTPHSGPITPPVSPVITTVPTDGEFYKVTYTEKDDIIQFNPDKFDACSALEIVYDGVNYGVILVSEDFFVPADKVNDKHTVEITCIDEDSKEIDSQTITIVHTPV